MSGRKLTNLMQDQTMKAQAGVVTADTNTEGAQGGGVATQFPRQFGKPNRQREEMMSAKKAYQAGVEKPFGELQATDDDFRYLMQKQDEVEEAQFDAWFGKNYDVASLAGRQFAQQINPEYFSAREAKMVARAKLALRIKLIESRGPRDQEDLMIQFGLNTGRIKLDEGWDRIGYTYDLGNGVKSKQEFSAGLTAPPKTQTRTQRVNNFMPNAPFQTDNVASRALAAAGSGSLYGTPEMTTAQAGANGYWPAYFQ